MLVKDVMTTKVITVSPETRVSEIARSLIDHSISAVPVVDEQDRPLGIVSEGDLIRRPESETERHRSWWLTLMSSPEEQAREYVKTHGLCAKDVMSTKLIAVDEETPLPDVASLLEKYHIKRVPVLRDGKVVGIISRANLLRGLIASEGADRTIASQDDRTLRERIVKAIEETGARTHLVSVIVSGGRVQLCGGVDSKEEKTAVRVAAEGIAGLPNVEENLSVFAEGSNLHWV